MSYANVPRSCEHCRADFLARRVDIAKGKARFCSKSCAQLSRGAIRRVVNATLRTPRKERYQGAHNALNYQIQRGRIVRQPCEVCGDPKSQAHHDDYSKPFDVRWLCQKHHVEHHKATNSWASQAEYGRLKAQGGQS